MVCPCLYLKNFRENTNRQSNESVRIFPEKKKFFLTKITGVNQIGEAAHLIICIPLLPATLSLGLFLRITIIGYDFKFLYPYYVPLKS